VRSCLRCALVNLYLLRKQLLLGAGLALPQRTLIASRRSGSATREQSNPTP
jgi:hypothetical protein